MDPWPSSLRGVYGIDFLTIKRPIPTANLLARSCGDRKPTARRADDTFILGAPARVFKETIWLDAFSIRATCFYKPFA